MIKLRNRCRQSVVRQRFFCALIRRLSGNQGHLDPLHV